MFSILLILFAAISCGQKPEDGRQFTTTDPAVAEHVKEFEDNYGQPISDIPINIVDLPDGNAGECIEYSNGKKEILIDKKFWRESDEHEHEQIIFHELGHCELHREHNDDEVDLDEVPECPMSVMHSKVFSGRQIQVCYKIKHRHYVDELFD